MTDPVASPEMTALLMEIRELISRRAGGVTLGVIVLITDFKQVDCATNCKPETMLALCAAAAVRCTRTTPLPLSM